MVKAETEFSDAAAGGATRKPIRLLAVIPAGAQALGMSLETALNAVPGFEVTTANLPSDASAPAILNRLAAKTQPHLFLVCASRNAITAMPVIFESIRKKHPELFILAILESAAPDELQRLVQMGATDFCLAPLRTDDLVARIIRWSSSSLFRTDVVAQDLERTLGLQQLLGKSRAFLDATNRIPKLAQCNASVFITGETGTGKEMCARAIHHLSSRAAYPFVPVNCGAIPSELVENELFGHDAGAFTSAASHARGLVCEAERGTLFLDEIDSLPLQTQVKLLRFLQDQEYRPLGAGKTARADVRIIAASNANLIDAIRLGRFRTDLYYRLNVLPLNLPPLRERREDIPLLAHHFVSKCAREFSASPKDLSRTALDKLLAHDWPGNVRELENLIRRAFVLSEHSVIAEEDIALPSPASRTEEMSFKALKKRAIAEFEAGYIRQLLATSAGNISQ
ncbi:MAG TPA: sigma-54 dependent transcriptional regulator, partial [Verrucomicrobiae bacterium]|nr:sigma-54 dependent transcriptional regulator [Verrucomicrobiae bacterium]